jgi:8-oxo-dGTP pyrophosphatase MutT (NUDIX family)
MPSAREDEVVSEQAAPGGLPISAVESAHAQLWALCSDPPRWPGLTGPAPATARDERRAAVLLLFGVLDDVPAHTREAVVARELDVLLVRRADTLTDHPGQVSFPGGRIDPDDDGPVGAALREAEEETGLDPTGVEVLGTIREVPLPVTSYRVTPVIGWWSRRSPVRAVDHRESAAVFRAPVADLLDPDHRRSVRLEVPGGIRTSPAFLVEDHLVWGFTAYILDQLFDSLGWTVPWDASRTVQVQQAQRPGR